MGIRDRDTLYILGDVVDRGPHGVEILQEIMRTPNMLSLIHILWDYATQPLNLMGQVCIGFSALWFLLSVPVSGLSLAMLQGLQKRMMFAKTEG